MGEIYSALMKRLASSLGESTRIKRTAKQEALNMTEEKQNTVQRMKDAANSGNVDCMFNLGCLYWSGEDLRYDPVEALHWFKMAAEAGHVTSMYNCGVLYHGKETTKVYDPAAAGYWLYRAAQCGDQGAKKMLEANYRFDNRNQRWVRR